MNDFNPLSLLDQDTPQPVPAAAEPAPAATPSPPQPVSDSVTGTPGAEEKTPTEVKTALVDKYRRRRFMFVAAAAAVIVSVGWWTVGGSLPGAAPSAQAQVAAGVDDLERNSRDNQTAALVKSDQAAALEHLATHGNLNGLQLPAGARYAAAGQTMVASRVVDETCLMYAIVDGVAHDMVADSTGAACTDTEIAAAQADLEAQEAALAAARNTGAHEAFASAARVAAAYATTNWTNGAPDLTGLPEDLGNGVRVTSNHGQYLTAIVGEGVSCRRATIGIDGSVGETSTC